MSCNRGRCCAAVVLIASAAGSTQAEIVYDAITSNTWRLTYFVEDETAQDTILSTGAGTMVRQVEVGAARNGGFPGTYNGTMTVRLWADAGGVPGALIAVATAPISLSDNVPHVFAAQFGGVVVPTATVWTGVQFSRTPQIGAGIVEGWSQPTVGGWGGHEARHYPDGTWNVGTGNSPSYIRIDTVPGPGALAAIGLSGLVAFRRRR